jgi:hypothetical protein
MATLVFDQLARWAGWAPPNSSREPEGLRDWLTSLGAAVAILATILGLLIGLVAPSRSHPGSDRLDVSTVMTQLWRRSFVASVAGGAAVGAFAGGLVSVTTDISRDDSPSAVGSVGGLLYGAVVGIVLGVGGGLVIGLAGSRWLVPFRGRRVTLVRTAASEVLVSAVFVCFVVFVLGSGPLGQMPAAEPSGIVLTSFLGALASTPYLIGWYIRLCTTAEHQPPPDHPTLEPRA